MDELPRGVYLTRNGSYLANIFIDGTLYRIGTFKTKEEAVFTHSNIFFEWFGYFPLNKKRIRKGDRRSSLREFNIWYNMIDRCTNRSNHAYEYYGGRGVFVCEEWKNDFWSFYKDMGPKPSKGHSLERIDNNSGYLPNNCKWATKKEQSSNRRRHNYKLDYCGIVRCGKGDFYYSVIKVNGKVFTSERFPSQRLAHINYLKVHKEWYGVHPKYVEIPIELNKQSEG